MDGLTFEEIEKIKADAKKAVTRQFRDAAEDSGWKPTVWEQKDYLPASDEAKVAPQENPAFTEGGEPVATTGEPVSPPEGPSIGDLRARAKELGLAAGGSKQDLTVRIAAAEAPNMNSDTTEGGN